MSFNKKPARSLKNGLAGVDKSLFKENNVLINRNSSDVQNMNKVDEISNKKEENQKEIVTKVASIEKLSRENTPKSSDEIESSTNKNFESPCLSKKKLVKKVLGSLEMKKKQELGALRDKVRRNYENLNRLKNKNSKLNQKFEEFDNFARMWIEAENSSPLKLAL